MKRAQRHPLLVAILVIGISLSAGFAALLYQNNRDSAARWLAERAELIEVATRQTVASTFADLRAVAAYMTTSDSVTQAEFSRFVKRIDMNPGVIGIGYLPIIADADLEAFLAEARKDVPGIELISFDGEGGVAPDYSPRPVYYPLRYVYGGPFLDLVVAETPISSQIEALGFDVGTEPLWAPSFLKSLESPYPTVSDLVGVGGIFEEQAFGAAHPILDSSGEIEGVLVAPGLEILLTADLGVAITSNVDWTVDTATPDATTSDWPVWRRELELPGSTWLLTVAPTDEALEALSSRSHWLVLAIGLALTAALAIATRQTQLRRQEHARVEELRQRSTDKDRFLATVSHELRTPLTVVVGLASELPCNPNLAETEKAELLGMIEQHGLEASAIVEDLLVAARSDIDKISIHHNNVDVATAVSKAVASSPFSSLPIVGECPPVYADEARLQQILRNLLTNAERYGGPNVEIRLGVISDQALITVADDGDPISQGHVQAIFDPYTSAHESNDHLGSIGLGLFISQKLARLMGGDLSYRHDGTHVLFELSLPLAALTAAGAVAD